MLTISLAQMDVATKDPSANLEKTQQFAKEAKERGSHLVVFPEMWTVGFDWKYNQEKRDAHAGTLEAVKAIAAQHAIWIHGSLPALVEGGGIANRSVLISAEGEVVAEYDKTHLFSFVGEDRRMVAGKSSTLADTPWGPVGLAICYDLRFPELFRKYAVQGAEWILLPSAFPEPRLPHWRTLIRARAIENQLFMLTCNQVGTKIVDKETTFFGSSCIIDPWGETVVEGGSEEELLTAAIDLSKAKKVRDYMHVLKDRRPEIY